MTEQDYIAYANDLTADDKGFVTIKGFLTSDEVDAYRDECEAFLSEGKVIHYRMNRDDMYDYIHPRTIMSDGRISKSLGDARQSNQFRIYQFLHNKHSEATEAIFANVLKLRDRIEGQWLHDDAYREQRDKLMDYVQVTKYVEDSKGLPKHQDSKVPLPFPLLQCLILLSEPGVDFEGGDLVVYPKTGPAVHLQQDVGFKKGDLILFDKMLFHEVLPTAEVPDSDVGRWSVVIGGRDKVRGSYLHRYLYRDPCMRAISPLRTVATTIANRLSSRSLAHK